jgi:hypothetical protein
MGCLSPLLIAAALVTGYKVVEEEEYNQFDEIASFDTSYKPQLFGTNKTPYCKATIVKKSIY